MWTIDQVMTRNPYCIGLSTPISQCEELMRGHNIRHLIVVNAIGHVSGCVSGASVEAAASDDRTVGDIIEPVEIMLEDDAAVGDVIDALIASAWDLAVIVDRNHSPVGIVTEHDIIGLAAEMLHEDELASRQSSGQIISVRETDMAGHALRQMIAHELRHLVVLDEHGGLAGVLSWRDLVRAGVEEDDEERLTSQFLPTGPLQKVVLDASLRRAAERMFSAKIGSLPIVDETGRPLWILTRTDVMRAMANLLDRSDI